MRLSLFRPRQDDAAATAELFDANFYRAAYHDVRDDGCDPLRHYRDHGRHEGRRPNAVFDPAWYAGQADVGDGDPLAHYGREGERAGLRPASFFDPARYRVARKLSRGTSALGHYLATRRAPATSPPVAAEPSADDGAAELAASGLFDASLYVVEGPDVREAGLDPLRHFCEHGWREGRRPNAYFDPAWYRGRHLREATVNPLLHYLRGGEAAGCRPVPFFDPAWYRHAYALPAGTSALGHFLAHRRSQRFAPVPDFDLHFYLANHGRELGPNRDPFVHFLLHGAGRDLDPSPAFDSGAYRAAHMATASVSPAEGPARWGATERRVPLVHWLDALPDRPATGPQSGR